MDQYSRTALHLQSFGATGSLNSILEGHRDLAPCHAMKDDSRLFELRNPNEAMRGWTVWF